jgi:hypothetical protein
MCVFDDVKMYEKICVHTYMCHGSWIKLAYNEYNYVNLWEHACRHTKYGGERGEKRKKESENLINYLLHDG